MLKKFLTLTALAVPLIVIPQVHLTFELPKTVAFYSFTILCALAFFIELFKNEKFYWPKLSKKFYVFLGLYFSSLVISAALALQPHTAIFGSYERQQGLITFTSYITFFLLIISTFSENKKDTLQKIFTFLEWICLTSFFIAALGILQYFFPILLTNYSTEILDGRIAVSTFGNPNFLAAYLLTTFPIFFILHKYSKQQSIKIFWIISIATSLCAVFLTATRSALLALFVGFIFYATIKNKKLLILSIILVAILAIINIFQQTQFVKNTEFLNRLTFSQESLRSLESRFYTWPATIEMIKERPLFGHGLENFKEAFLKFSPKELLTLERFIDSTDRAHNEILDTAATTGFFGLISYLLFLFYAIYIGIKNKIENQFLSSISFASAIGLIMLFANNMFSFSPTEIRLQQFILMGIIFALSTTKIITKKISLKKFTKIISVVVLTTLAIFGVYRLSIKPLIADYYFDKGYSNSLTADKKTVLEYFGKAILTNPNQTLYAIKSAKYSLLSSKYSDINDKKLLIDIAEQFLKKAVKNIGESQFDTLLVKAEIDSAKENYDSSFVNFEKAINLAPNNPEAILEYARTLSKAQKYKESLSMYEKYLNLSEVWKNTNFSTDEAKKQFRIFFKNAPQFITAIKETANVAGILNDTVKYTHYKTAEMTIKNILKELTT